jgi:ATP-dependent Clp protease ATP-binding subunit ClpA
VVTEHLLLGIIREGSGIAAAGLKKSGIDLEALAAEIERSVSTAGGMMTSAVSKWFLYGTGKSGTSGFSCRSTGNEQNYIVQNICYSPF